MARPPMLSLVLICIGLGCEQPDTTRVEAERALKERIDRLESRITLLEGRPAPASVPPPTMKPLFLVIDVGVDKVHFLGEDMDVARLEERLRERVLGEPDLAIKLNAAADLPNARTMAIMDAVKRAGVARVGLSTDPKAGTTASP